MTTELFWLACTVVMTAVFWVPYILNRFMEYGILTAVQNPRPDEPPAANWAKGMVKAHTNAVENLVIFAPLVLVLNAAGISTEATVTATMVYFWARLIHFVAYALNIPYLRTVTFLTGFAAQMTLAVAILG